MGLLLFLHEKTSAPHKLWMAAATYRKFLEPFLHFFIDSIALLVHKLGKLHIDIAKYLENASARVKCIA